MNTIEELAREKALENNRVDDLDLHLVPGSVAISAQYFVKIIEEIGDNAFRYSTKGTPVYFGTVTEGDTLLMMVIDRGRGMTGEQIENMGAYVQFNRKVYEQQGSGLGLTVAKQLIEMHGGSLSIQSDIGRGTSVTVRLPLAAGSATPD